MRKLVLVLCTVLLAIISSNIQAVEMRDIEATLNRCRPGGGGECICPSKKEPEKNCKGKNSQCGEEPLEKYGYTGTKPNWKAEDQTKWAECHKKCTQDNNSIRAYNELF